ncbi:dTDP-3-amino-3,6-dideoxy-alpha-D-galactopyranose transaminase [compost metagenome]
MLPNIPKNAEEHVWHLFVIRSKERDKLSAYLKENGIQTHVHYPVAPHKQEAYKEMNDLHFPITEKIHDEVLSLPISNVLDKSEVSEIIRVINEFK